MKQVFTVAVIGLASQDFSAVAVTPGELVQVLAVLPDHNNWGYVSICATHLPSCVVNLDAIKFLANNLLRQGFACVHVLGECWPIETAEDFVAMLKKVSTEFLVLQNNQVYSISTLPKFALRGE